GSEPSTSSPLAARNPAGARPWRRHRSSSWSIWKGRRGWQRLLRTLVRPYVVPTHAPSAKDTSATTHCHAATAQLTREYQSDHRRYVLTPATTCAVHPICAGHPLMQTLAAKLGIATGMNLAETCRARFP